MARRPDLVKRQEWARRLRRFDSSKLSVRQFCLAEGVSTAAFAYWSRAVGRASEPGGSQVASAAFTAVEVVSRPLADEPSAVVVRLPRGITIELPTDRPDLLQTALSTLVAEAGVC